MFMDSPNYELESLNPPEHWVHRSSIIFWYMKGDHLQSYFWSRIATHLCSIREFNRRSTVLPGPGPELCSPVPVVTDNQNNWWSIQTDFTCNSIPHEKWKNMNLKPYPTILYTALVLSSVYFTDYLLPQGKSLQHTKGKKRCSEK